MFAVLFLIGFAAWAGSRAKDSDGSVPTASTDGVSLSEVTGCRASVRSDGGTTINGGTLVLYYYDAVLGWAPSQSSLDCTLDAHRAADGGAGLSLVCPDTRVTAPYGRVAVNARSLTSSDGGVPTALVRIECFGPNLP